MAKRINFIYGLGLFFIIPIVVTIRNKRRLCLLSNKAVFQETRREFYIYLDENETESYHFHLADKVRSNNSVKS